MRYFNYRYRPARIAIWSAILALFVSIGAPAPSWSCAPDACGEFVRDLGDQVIGLAKDDSLTPPARDQALRDLLRRGLALDKMGRFVLGRYWRTASADERSGFLQALEQFTIRSFTSRLQQLQGLGFAIKGARAEGSSGAIVSSIVKNNGEPPVNVNWRVHDVSGQPKIVDIYVEGVSLLIAQRDETASIIRRNNGSIAALIEDLEARTAALDRAKTQ